MAKRYATKVLNGDRWRIYNLAGCPQGDLGQVDFENKRIHLPIHGDGKHDMDTIIHEAVHTLCPRSEQLAEQIARAANELLWLCGWRKEE
jgi:hypothetical protein